VPVSCCPAKAIHFVPVDNERLSFFRTLTRHCATTACRARLAEVLFGLKHGNSPWLNKKRKSSAAAEQ